MELDKDTIYNLTCYSPFRGPQIYFHIKTIERRYGYEKPSQAAGDIRFIEYLYATLIAWGIGSGRGRGKVRLVEFDDFRSQIKQAAGSLDALRGQRIEAITQVHDLSNRLWAAVDALAITVNEDGSPVIAKIVSGSKTLHHLLPDLIPPIDNKYTPKFFGRGPIGQGKEPVFRDVFCDFVRWTKELHPHLTPLVRSDTFNTSIPKVMDNMIVGSIAARLTIRYPGVSDKTTVATC